MGVGMLNAANSQMMGLMQVLMQGMQAQTELCESMVAMSVENGMAGEQMAIAQQIIDVYA